MPTLRQAMEAAQIETTIKRVEVPASKMDDKWSRTAFHYRVVFTIRGLCRSNDRSYVTEYATGHGWARVPTPMEVMRSVLSEARDVTPEYGEWRFEPWAENFGYDTDSRKAEALFKQVQQNAVDLEEFLTLPLFRAWMADEQLWTDEKSDLPTRQEMKLVPLADRQKYGSTYK